MATATLRHVNTVFPPDTVVAAYPRSQWNDVMGSLVLTIAGPASYAIAPSGTWDGEEMEFANLEPNTPYVAHAIVNGKQRVIFFTTKA
jgi:hypothetical protein